MLQIVHNLAVDPPLKRNTIRRYLAIEVIAANIKGKTRRDAE